VSLALVLVAVAACGGSSATPTPSTITDPRQILAQSLSNVAKAHTLHFSGTIAGSLEMGELSKLGGSSLPLTGTLKLDGGTITGDVDSARQAAHLTVAFPAVFGLTADLIQVDGYSYTRINLTSDKYSKSRTDLSAIASAVPGAGASSGVTDMVVQLGQLLDGSGTTATLAGHSKVAGRDAYELTLAIPADRLSSDLASLAPGLPSGLSLESATVTYWVYADTMQPAQLRLRASSTSLGNLDVSVTLTRYDQAVKIEAPPASQVES